VAAAYFLAGRFDVDVFEARSRIGGHCDSRAIEHGGRQITVDLGAQFFHPDTHPIYVTLLEELGLYDPEHAGVDATVEAPASLCIFRTAGGAPIFSSSHPLSTPQRAIDFAAFTQLARQAVLLMVDVAALGAGKAAAVRSALVVNLTVNPSFLVLDPGRLAGSEPTAFDAMSEEERYAAARSDPDCPPATEAQLARARRRREAAEVPHHGGEDATGAGDLFAAGFLFGRGVGARVEHLTQAGSRWSLGELSSPAGGRDFFLARWVPPEFLRDEINQLADQLDQMRESFRQAIERIRKR
jgi:hypothetical protein